MKLPAVFATIVAVLVMFTFQKMSKLSKLSFDLFLTFHNLPCCPAREIQLECQGNTVGNVDSSNVYNVDNKKIATFLGPFYHFSIYNVKTLEDLHSRRTIPDGQWLRSYPCHCQCHLENFEFRSLSCRPILCLKEFPDLSNFLLSGRKYWFSWFT